MEPELQPPRRGIPKKMVPREKNLGTLRRSGIRVDDDHEHTQPSNSTSVVDFENMVAQL